MLLHYTDEPIINSPGEVIIDKHSPFVFLIPVAALIITIILTVKHCERRFVGACWLAIVVLFVHFVIERRELYYYGISESGISQYNVFTKAVRRIPWKQVVQIGIRGGRYTAGMLVITILGAPKWNGKKRYNDQTWYYLSNRPNVIIIEKWKPAQEVIQKYYGSFDY